MKNKLRESPPFPQAPLLTLTETFLPRRPPLLKLSLNRRHDSSASDSPTPTRSGHHTSFPQPLLHHFPQYHRSKIPLKRMKRAFFTCSQCDPLSIATALTYSPQWRPLVLCSLLAQQSPHGGNRRQNGSFRDKTLLHTHFLDCRSSLTCL